MTAQQALARARVLDPDATRFVVRLWDGFDAEWTDVCEPTTAEKAMRVWDEHTDEGMRNTAYDDIDYYAIYPSTVKMTFSDEGIGSQHG